MAAGRSGVGAQVGLWAVAAAWMTWNARLTWDSVVDDAWISARYGAQVAAGHGMVFNQDGPPVEGVTNLLWTVWLAIGRLLNADMLDWMLRSGWLFALTTLALTIPVTSALSGRRDATSALPALMLSLFPHFAVVATNGLETTQWMTGVLGVIAAWLTLDGRARWGLGAAGALLVWVRPEAAAVLCVLLAFDAWNLRRSPVGVIPFAAPVALSQLTLFAWRWSTYGVLLPNTWYAKTSFPITETFRVNADYFGPETRVLVAFLATFAVAAALKVRDNKAAGVAAVALALALIPLNVSEWMPGLRLFQPSFALTLCFVGALIGRLDTQRAGFASAGAVLAMTLLAWESGDRARNYDNRHTVARHNGASTAAWHVGHDLPKGEWLATRDAGVFAYFVGVDVNVAELHNRALTQPHPDGKDALIQSYTPRNPAIFVSTFRTEEQKAFEYSNDERIWQGMNEPYTYLGRVNQHYRRQYDVYVRADLGVPPLASDLVVSTAGTKPGEGGGPPPSPAPPAGQ